MEKIIELIKSKKIFLISSLAITILFCLDIGTKRLAFNAVDNLINKTAGIHSYIPITSFFNIVKVVNTGVSFGMFNELAYGQIILSLITAAIIAFVIYLLYRSTSKFDAFVYSLIIAGGFGNLYDRIIYGGVFDFLDFHIGEYHWPAFNIADSMICVGVFLLIADDLIKYIRK